MAGDPGHANDIRCDCGRLVARRVGRTIEIKCRRCDRTTVISLDALADGVDIEGIERD